MQKLCSRWVQCWAGNGVNDWFASHNSQTVQAWKTENWSNWRATPSRTRPSQKPRTSGDIKSCIDNCEQTRTSISSSHAMCSNQVQGLYHDILITPQAQRHITSLYAHGGWLCWTQWSSPVRTSCSPKPSNKTAAREQQGGWYASQKSLSGRAQETWQILW